MRLVYFGTSGFAEVILSRIEPLWPSIELVVTQPDRPSGRGLELKSSPVKLRAQELGLRLETPEKARNQGFVERIRELGTDALLVASYGQILSEELLQSAKRGGINLHASLLPKYRGAAPIQRAILEGETKTGITLMQMDKGMDTGDIIAAEETPIDPDETAGALELRLAEIAAEMALSWMPKIARGEYPRTPQEDALATCAPKMSRKDGEVGFDMRAEDAYRVFRAATPRPGCFLKTARGELKLLECRLGKAGGEPGEVLGIEGGALLLAFKSESVAIMKGQFQGKKAFSGNELANGLRLTTGFANLR